MNRRFCVWVGSILGSVCLAGISAGQVSPPVLPASLPPGGAAASAASTIPYNAYGAADETPYLPQITTFVKDQMTGLTGVDAVAASVAREKLKGAIPRGSTPAYYSAFAKVWSTQCSAVLAKAAPLGVRLNIAIVTAQLADVGQTTDVTPLVLQLLGDREPVIAWWGIKAARPLITILILYPSGGAVAPVTASKLPDAIVVAVKKCGKSDLSGFATVDAYTALKASIPGKSAQQMNPLLPPLVKPVLDILDYRISQMIAGAVLAPGAERDIGTWLSGVYPFASTAEQHRIVQLLVNVETYAGQRAALYQNSKKDLAAVRDMLKYIASALKVIGNFGGANNDVQNMLNTLTSMTPGASPADMLSRTAKVFPTMQLVFTELKQPTTIPTIDPPPPLPTKPTTPAPAPAQ